MDNITNKAIEQIKIDVADNDFSAIAELLELVPTENLIEYLSQVETNQ